MRTIAITILILATAPAFAQQKILQTGRRVMNRLRICPNCRAEVTSLLTDLAYQETFCPNCVTEPQNAVKVARKLYDVSGSTRSASL